MNKDQYDRAYREAEQLYNKVKDLIDDAEHHLGREVLQSGHRLFQDIKSQKNPRTLEDSVKRLIKTFEAIHDHGDEIMDFHHSRQFIDGYQNMVMGFRKFDNY